MDIRKRYKLSLAALSLGFLICAGATDMSLTGVGVEKGYLADAGGATPSAVAVAHAAGEFRIAAANILWMNVVDHYHHQSMAQGKDWSKNRDLLPLIHMIVALDPHFTQAYDVGALILCELHEYDEAQGLLNEAIENNAADWNMEYDMAMLHAWYLKDPVKALPYALKAHDIAADLFDKRRIWLLVGTLKRQIREKEPAAPSLTAPQTVRRHRRRHHRDSAAST